MQLDTAEFWIWTSVATVFAIASGYFSFASLRRARLIEDTPTSKIRSAAQGFVELDGIARTLPEKTVNAYLTGRECCWYRYEIEKKSDKNWRTIEKGSSEDPLLLEDETGKCIILPKGAEVTATERSVWYGSERFPEDRHPASERITLSTGLFNFRVDSGFQRHSSGKLFSFSHYRYTEERIYSGDPLYALGDFRSLDDKDHHRAKREITAELMKFWKNDQKTLLKRFDADGDGNIDAQEWDTARQAAAGIAAQKHAKMLEQSALHILSRPTVKGMPFLLSTIGEFSLARRYRNWSRVLIVIFLASSTAAVYLTGSHF